MCSIVQCEKWRSRETISRWLGLQITVARIIAINTPLPRDLRSLHAMYYAIGGKNFLVKNEV
jgi:hypothetical protein